MKTNTNKIYFVIYLSLIFLVCWPLGWTAFLFFPFGLFVGYFILLKKFKDNNSKNKISNYWLLVISIVFILSRLIPFIIHGGHPLGYDTGFYYHKIQEQKQVLSGEAKNLIVLPVDVSQLGIDNKNIFGYDVKPVMTESFIDKAVIQTLLKLGFSDSAILYGFYIFLGLIIGIFIFLLAKKYFNKQAAIYSVFFYVISMVQFMAYYYILWKNFLGLAFLLFVFYCLSRKTILFNILALISTLIIFGTHRTTAFVLVVSLLIYYLITKKRYRFFVVVALFIVLGIFAWWNQGLILHIIEQLRSGFTAHYDFFSLQQGDFLNIKQYLSYALLYLPFSIASFLYLVQKKKRNPIIIMAGTTGILVLFRFMYYQRLLIFLDIALLILAGYGLYVFLSNIKNHFQFKYLQLVIAVFMFLLSVLFLMQVTKINPAISKEKLQDIISLQNVYPEAYVFSEDNTDTPWLYGFSGHPIITPGWGSDWEMEEWDKYWTATSEEKLEILNNLNKKLIILNNNIADNKNCFKKINDSFCLIYKIN